MIAAFSQKSTCSVDGYMLVVPVSRPDFVLLNDYSIITEVYLQCRWLHACGSSAQTGFRLAQ